MSVQTPAPAADTASPAQVASPTDSPAITPAASVAAERERVRGIMQHAEAAGRGTLAEHLAYDTDMSVDEAAKVLAAAPKETAAHLDASTALDRMMEAEEQPNLTAGTGGNEGQPTEAQRIANSWAAATGVKLA